MDSRRAPRRRRRGSRSRGSASPTRRTDGRPSPARRRSARRGPAWSDPAARSRRRSAARPPGRGRRGGVRSHRRAQPPGRRRRRPIGHRDRRRGRVRPGRVGGHGSRAASSLSAFGRRSVRSASNGTAKTSCSTKATRSAGVSESSTTSIASPTESPAGFLLGIDRASGLRMGSGRCVSSDASRRVLRDRSMLRLTRPTTVVSHARRLSTSLVSVRLRRIQAPGRRHPPRSGAEHPKGDATQWGGLPRSARRASPVVHP